MVTTSVEMGQVYTGILSTKGMQGMWVIWSGLLGVFIVPIVFAPLWASLNYPTDNQFILHRFSGIGAKYLHVFRSFYVGLLVTSVLISFHILAFSRVIETFFSLDRSLAILISGAVLLLFSFKNKLESKMHFDLLHGLIYAAAIIVSVSCLNQSSFGFIHAKQVVKHHFSDVMHIFPQKNQSDDWYIFLTYIGVQWWSAQLFDGGGPEMKRFSSATGKWGAIRTALLPIGLNTLLLFLFLAMAIMTLSLNTHGNEVSFLQTINQVVPEWLKPVCVLGFFAVFITTSEGLLNWGASFITIDVASTHFQWPKKPIAKQLLGVGTMASLSIFAMLIAFFSSSLLSIIEIVLSISAGVAPVYILRWFWFRINAWSQLSAMLISGLTTVIFSMMYGQTHFPLQIVTVTSVTTVVWLLVTFLTPKDDIQVVEHFKQSLPGSKIIIKKMVFALFLGLCLLLITIAGVHYLFS